MGNCQKQAYEDQPSELTTGVGIYSFKKEVA